MTPISACSWPPGSTTGSEPAVAVKRSVRPGSSSVCCVIESGGSLRLAGARLRAALTARPLAAGALLGGRTLGALGDPAALRLLRQERCPERHGERCGGKERGQTDHAVLWFIRRQG